ncbi:PREDICTED: zinc finger SWIM domain-containing protein 8 [Ceratosolen solmsi marchali]|uniref:Zinc finger SWIM domain-containing protein 8 n=1 Tax=Ceratosolen solmsi marchali TaxID=326594 RepID=A0AAJ7DXP1_9HYME|nr:PREDICTED: zinc finger SWIM domain-containing protein 8 [Ceratosolen solmsi marchali]
MFFRSRNVKDPLQIGFHLSATVTALIVSTSGFREQYNVAVTFDRRRITSCNCTCSSAAYWCSHVVAVCLHRIHMPTQVCLRAPVSESLSRLQREQLQKFAQYLISELPQQILPTAQRLLDELLSATPSAINTYCGAPDPTAGASANDQTSWYLDEKTLHKNIKKILIKFCVPAPIVFSDVNYLSTTAPPAAAEWSSLLRPLRGREPEGMWNLLSIVREMFKRTDRNAIPLLEIITEECLACEQILVWWFNTKVALLNGNSYGGGKHGNMNSNAHASQHACSSLCDEIVILWRLAALNPGLSPSEREMLHGQFTAWHMKTIDKLTKVRGTPVYQNAHNRNNGGGQKDSPKTSFELFIGFKPALEACYLDWEEYTLPGITYTASSNPMYHCPFTCFRHTGDTRTEVNQVNSSSAVLNCQPPSSHHHSRRQACLVEFSYMDRRRLNHRYFPGLCSRAGGAGAGGGDGNRSSDSSEGFCENDGDIADMPELPVVQFRRGLSQMNNCCDTDSQEGGGSESSSNSNVIMKKSHCSGQIRSNASSESQSDTSDSSMQKLASDGKCSGGGVVVPSVASTAATTPGCSKTSSATVSASTSASPAVVVTNGQASAAPVAGAATTAVATPEKKEGTFDGDKDPSRRPSKDESSCSSSDSPSGDEYNVYYYDPKAAVNNATGKDPKVETHGSTTANVSIILGNLKIAKDPWDILFARAEGLYAHGHTREACILGVKLAKELLANPPDLMIEVPPMPVKGKRKKQQVNPASHQLTCSASATLAKCGFLCTVLAENPEYYNLAFHVGLFGLEMARPPASTKSLEVKLAHQESELVNLLKRIPLGAQQVAMLRIRAKQLRDGLLRSRGHALLPIMLASFIFDALNMPRIRPFSEIDENLGFDAAVAALGLKANVSEADHPLLCEGTRRQRGELSITLLVFYKDEPMKVARIMDKLLDRDVHQLIKSPIVSSYYSSNPPTKSQLSNFRREKACSSPLTGPEASSSNEGVLSANSRPHSSTSAELETSMSTLTVQPQPAQQSVSTRTKENSSSRHRFKSKRASIAKPSIPNQPSEAGAHFMFELGKTVLTKAGGNSSTSLFTQASTSQNHHGPHRALHMCAFQLGLYALGLHNCVSPNWLSRTYSSHVGWITGQAMEIGAPAIWFLIDSWEGHLTPPEAVSIADKSSRGSDLNIVRAAAELALSCLPHAHALNPNEIQRAILQCKEQSDLMLEKACITVENTAKGGGVYPEVLFQVAKYWYEMYLRHTPGGEQQDEMPHDSLQLDANGTLMVEPCPPVDIATGQLMPGQAQTVVVTSAQPPPQPYVHPAITTLAPLEVGLPYTVSPYSFVHPHHQFPHQPFGGPMPPHRVAMPPQPPNMQMYRAYPRHPAHPMHHPQIPHHPPQTQPPAVSQFYAPQPTVTTVNVHPPPGTQHMFTMQQPVPINVQAGISGPMPGQNGLPGPALIQAQPIMSTVRTQPQQQVHRQNQSFTPQQFRALVAAYRVGMLALETLSRRVHDDRPQAKYARNPPYGEDVKWLLRVSKRLGTQYLHQMCVTVVNSIVSPFVLHDVALEAAFYLSRNNPTIVIQQLRSALLAPLVHKCQQMYFQSMHQKLYLLMPADYEEFASLVRAARAAFHITPEGHTQFKEWLQSIKRSQSCNKDLWMQINAALQQNGK